MYAIAFDMVITDLRANYGEPYNNAYFEINKVLRQYEFNKDSEVKYTVEEARKTMKEYFPQLKRWKQ